MTADVSDTPIPPPPKPEKRRRWRKRFISAGCILVLLGMAIRVLLPLSLPVVLRKIAGIYGMNCTYDRMELNSLSGDAGIWGLEFTPKEGGPPILSADYCHGNLSVLNLFRGRLNVWRLEADGVDANIDRAPDGHLPLLDRFVGANPRPPATVGTPAKTPGAKPGEIDLSSPLRLDALRLEHLRVHIHDRRVNPPLDTELAMELRLNDLGSPTRPTKFELNLSADPVLDSLNITGEGRSGGKTLDATVNVLGRGLHLKAAAPYLAPLGIRPVSDDITLRAAGRIHTGAARAGKDGFAGTMVFDHLSATADEQESLALDRITVDAGEINTTAIHLDRIVLDGVRATAGRGADGNLSAAGVEYDPTLLSSIAPAPAGPPTPLPPVLVALASEPWSIGEFAVRNARLDLHDRRVSPNVDLSLITDELSAKYIVHDPLHLDTTVTLAGMLHAPGLVRDVKLAGAVQPFLQTKTFRASVDATGIRPDALRSYLDPIGLESRLKNGEFVAAVDASLSTGPTITANVKVPTFELRDGAPLLRISAVNVSNLTWETKTGKIGVGAIEITGPGVSVVRDSSGQISLPGVRTKPVVAGPSATPMTRLNWPTPAAATIASLPRIAVGQFIWDHVAVDFEDQTMAPPVKLSLNDVAVEASDLSTDLHAARAGRFRARLTSPALAKRLEAAGTLTPSADALRLDASVNGSGLNATAFAAYLKPFGIQPVLSDGTIGLNATAEVVDGDAGLSASLGLDHLRYAEGAKSLASVDDLQVNGVSLRGGVVGVDAIKIVRPHAAAGRDADGTLVAGGIRFLPAKPADPNTTGATAAAHLPPAIPSMPFVVTLKQLCVTDAGLDWSDRAVRPAVNTGVGASVELDNLTVGKDAPPAAVLLTAHATGSADELKVSGTISAAPSHLSSTLAISATGLRVGPLASYLPPSIGSSLNNAHFQTTVDAAVTPGAAGGLAAKLIVGPLIFQDADQPPLFQMDSVRLVVPRIDLPYNAVDIDELSVTGVQARAERTPGGELAFMGLLLGEKARPTPPQPAAMIVAAAAEPTVAPPASAPSVHDLIASARVALPAVTVEKLNVDVSKLTLADAFRPSARPLVVSDFTLRNINRIDWLGKNAASKPATHLQLVCKVEPLIEHVRLDATVTPFARQPALQADFLATGVHGSGLTDLIPELKQQLNGASMTDGRIEARLEAEAKLDRRSPLDFDVSHGLDLSFVLSHVQYRGTPNGPVLAGVDEVRSEGVHIQPVDSIVHVRTLEITKPTGFISQDAAGIHALGWVYKMPTAQTGQSTAQPAVASVSTSPALPTSLPPPKGEVRVDKLVISGLDFRVEDSAVRPPLVIPLNGLDVEVRNISSRLPYEDKPVRFSAIVNAGKVRLPIRGKPGAFEQRDLFSQITANGEVSLYPKLHGWAKTSVSGLDLAAFRGPAEQFGETLTNGLYDSTVDLRFDPGGAIAVNSRFTLTDLSLSEPPNGPIYRYLHLPAPLDVAIGSVQGADGAISLPINVSVDPNHVSYADVGLAAAGGVSQVIVVALASAPLKAMNDMGAIVGLGGAKKQAQSQSTTVPFIAGSTSYQSSASLQALLIRLRHDPQLTVTVRHQLGAGDLKVLQVRANPTPEQCVAVEAQLRGRRAELLRLRSDAAGVARAQLLSLGAPGSNGALEQLRAIDREIAATDESLDQVGELLRPGADRLAERRTRSVALLIAAERLDEIKQMLRDAGIAADRLRIITPQFNPDPTLEGGQAIITTVRKK